MTVDLRFPQMATMPPGSVPVGEVGVGRRAIGFGDSVRVSVSSRGGIGDASSVDAEIEADITTSDALGDQFKAAFKLPAPAMPEVIEGLKG